MTILLNSVYVGIGGCFGAIFRYLITLSMNSYWPGLLPYGTLVVNGLGGFFIGLLMAMSLALPWFGEPIKLFLITGFLGGLTTFSTFSHETMALFLSAHWLMGTINIFLNVFFALLGVLLGRWVFHLF